MFGSIASNVMHVGYDYDYDYSRFNSVVCLVDSVEHSVALHDLFALLAQGGQVGVQLGCRKAFLRHLVEDSLEAVLADFFLPVDLDPDLVQVRQEFLVAPAHWLVGWASEQEKRAFGLEELSCRHQNTIQREKGETTSSGEDDRFRSISSSFAFYHHKITKHKKNAKTHDFGDVLRSARTLWSAVFAVGCRCRCWWLVVVKDARVLSLSLLFRGPLTISSINWRAFSTSHR